MKLGGKLRAVVGTKSLNLDVRIYANRPITPAEARWWAAKSIEGIRPEDRRNKRRGIVECLIPEFA